VVTVPTVDLVDRPETHGYDGAIDNVLIRLAVAKGSPLQDITAEAAPPRVDTASAAEDIRDEVGRRYSRSDLSGGAGLDFLHERGAPDDASIRYWDSRGIDVFSTDRGGVYESRLMNRTSQDTSVAGIIDVFEIEGVPYYATATDLHAVGGASVASPTGATKVLAMGKSAYTLDSTGVGRWDLGTWSRVSVSAVATYTDMWAVKSRILTVQGNILYDATDDSILLTLPPADTITDVVDIGPAIVVLGTTGSIYFFALNESSTLVQAGESPFTDEIPYLVAESFGVLGIVTTSPTEAGGVVARFYTGTLAVTGSYDVADLQLIYQVGDRDTTDDHTPQFMFATRDSIYTAIREAGETATTLWRYFLPTGGYARAHEFDTGFADDVLSVIEIDDRMYAALGSDGVWKEDDEFVVSGYVVGPLADHFTSETKQWVGADLTGAALPIGTGLELYDTTDPALITNEASTSWQLVAQLNDGDAQITVSDLSGRDSRYHAGKVVYRSDGTRLLSPSMRSYSFRAFPNPNRDILLRIPLNVSDQIESPGRRAVSIPGRGQAIEDALRAFEGKHVLVTLYRPELQVRGLIEQFESTIETIPTFGSVRRVMYARIRGTDISVAATVTIQTNNDNLGQNILGRVLLGVGDPDT